MIKRVYRNLTRRRVSLKWAVRGGPYSYYIVNDFATRKMTYHTDKLPAISGLAREVRRMTDGQYSYKAGIWRSRKFEYQGLLWGITTPFAARYEKFIAPSWSWASMDLSGVAVSQDGRSKLYNERLLEDLRPKMEVKIMSTKPVGGDPYMQVLGGHLKIEGMCCNVCCCEIPSVFFDIHDGSHAAPIGPWEILKAIDSSSSDGIPGSYVEMFKGFKRDLIGKAFCEGRSATGTVSGSHQPLLLLEMAEWSSPMYRSTASICLILERSEFVVNNEEETFKRVGRAFVLKEPAGVRDLSRWQSQILTIK
ncbi:uncharacterized protein PAC_17914 [Phialocephala subalpina]|uniref:Heterokaryon incompatibility domain-containing protein n=1 Tax=Phialocephala subalpina TaxID=576137 RepID=A0A1L7XSL6_9HELO|nr:uncharacterized protein PAC_17914 [Phialocephala subalpina]